MTLKNSQGNTKVVKDAGMELLGAAFKPVSSELKRQLNLGYGLEVTGVSNGKMQMPVSVRDSSSSRRTMYR